MKSEHQDKALDYTPPRPLLGRRELFDELANAERHRLANLAPDERAARPSDDERKALDAAMAGWQAARLHREQAGAALASRRAELRALESVGQFRGAGGTVEDRRLGSDPEIATAERAVRAAQTAAEAALEDEGHAQRRYNEVAADVAAAGGGRRRRIRAEADFAVWKAGHPAATEREVREAEEVYGLADRRWVR